jgi:hypothetical protein
VQQRIVGFAVGARDNHRHVGFEYESGAKNLVPGGDTALGHWQDVVLHDVEQAGGDRGGSHGVTPSEIPAVKAAKIAPR